MSAAESKYIALTDLLAEAFDGDPAGLRRWVRTSLGQQAHQDLPGEVVSFRELVFQTMDIMRRCGHVNASSFQRLCAARPGLAGRVREVAREWGIEVELARQDAHIEPDAFGQHAELLRWLYEECPVLGVEPFSLAEIYIETGCSKSTWGRILSARQREERIRSSSNVEGSAPQPLTRTLLEVLGDPKFKDAIVIQGPPGAGKSSFTLHLANELIKQGLQPILLALRDVQFRESFSLASALPEAVRLGDERQRPPKKDLYADANLFRDDSIFEQAVDFCGARICRYVLILDGWDEISVGASASYLERVELLLREVRQRFLERRAFPLRVILTGRPSDAIEQSGFLRKETVLLTVRSFTPEQLESYVAKVRRAVIHQSKDNERARFWRGWEDEERWTGIVTGYRRASEEFWRRFEPSYGSIEVLGVPLLAYLALRLVALWPGDVSPLLEDSTTLLRSLIALVIGQGGKPEEDDYPLEGRPVLTGDTLRALLQRTARAMTILGRESVSHDELMHELALEESSLNLQVCNLDKQILSRLVISFFFRGGRRDLGCEFTHKSFREYLFAESLVELLKKHGRQGSDELPERSAGRLWKDFAADDPRYSFCRELAEVLGCQWMSQEVAMHFSRLVSWEVARAVGTDRLPVVGLQTECLDVSGWGRIRDSLADVWDWWMNETHLCPQLRARDSEGRKDVAFEVVPPMAFDIIGRQRHEPPTPTSFRPQSAGSLDARLGDGLFRLAAIVHAELASHQGYCGATSVRQGHALDPGQDVRRYQSCVRAGHDEWVLFSPCGREPQSLSRILARINAGDNRPAEAFPAGVSAQYADLRGLKMRAMELRYTELRGANLAGADLHEAILSKEGYCGADGEGGPDLRDVVFRDTQLWHANLTLADLRGADLSGVMVSKGTLHSAALDGAFGLDEIQVDEEEEANSW